MSASLLTLMKARAAASSSSNGSSSPAGTPNPSRTSTPHPPSSPDLFTGASGRTITGLGAPRTGAPLTVPQRIAFGELVLKKFKITDEKKSALVREFLETSHPEEREILWFIADAADHEETTSLAIETAKQWTPSTAEVALIRKYVQMLIMLPDLKYYNGALARVVVNAILAQRGHGFPTSDNEVAFEAFNKVTARQVTLALSRLKAMVTKSMENKSDSPPPQHIHNLADDLLTSFATDLGHTLSVYHRIALLRRHVRQNHPAHSFWDKVDDELQGIHEADAVDAVAALQLGYEIDDETYPAPTDAKRYSLSQDGGRATSQAWVKRLNTAAKKVTRITASKKRKRARKDTGDEDPEENDEDNEPPVGDEEEYMVQPLSDDVVLDLPPADGSEGGD
ncbi:hypothetical protein C8F01DRAFT_1276162 [Mycena amicta]|nr:hypothetical protein C8F01DRAFT_1276162 [Mycena amicta]